MVLLVFMAKIIQFSPIGYLTLLKGTEFEGRTSSAHCAEALPQKSDKQRRSNVFIFYLVLILIVFDFFICDHQA
jgi:predicted nucleic acid-binding Zn ribbon protein